MSSIMSSRQKRHRSRFIGRSLRFIVVAVVFLTFIGWSSDDTIARFGNPGWIHWSIGVFSLFFGLLLANATVENWLDRRALCRYRVDPDAELDDGQQVALSGRIRIDGAPVEAPFSGSACAGYRYEVSGERHDRAGGSTHTRKQLCLFGHALTSAVLECGSRRFPINAVPDFDINLWTSRMGGDWGRRAMGRIERMAEAGPPIGELQARGEIGAASERFEGPQSVDRYVAPTRGTDTTLNVNEYILPMDTDVTILATFSYPLSGLDGRRWGGMKVFPGTFKQRLAAMDQELGKDWKVSLGLLAVGVLLTGLVWWLP